MATLLPEFKARVPDYWLDVNPNLDDTTLPHLYNGNVPAYKVDGGVAIDVGGTPTNAQSGVPGFFYPLGTNEADLAALKANVTIGDGTGPSDEPWNVKGNYIVLDDGSETHYRLDAWQLGRVP